MKNKYRIIRKKGWPYTDKWLIQRSKLGLFWITIYKDDVDAKTPIDEHLAEIKRVEAL